ncbi:MAG TPA: hypothetical protein VL993_09625 [Stellaceae bacterium]|nr:hypothetical protein [Stellaceae bacterium]
MSEHPSHRSSSGFMLVELLVVLTLLGLLSTLLFGGLRYAAHAAAAGTAILGRASDATLAETFLRSVLADARPMPDEEDASIAFAGERDRVDLVGEPPSRLAPGGFYRIEIGLDRQTHVLAVRWTRLSHDGMGKRVDASPLVDHVADVAFGYFGAGSGDEGPSWHDTWEEQGTLPGLVRMRVAFTDGTQAPDLVVAVRGASAQ